ncbi:MAG: phage gp6-like head-tail connector protein [Candidatus Symbiopectobacterium sp. Dall1.0]|nr:phage gp6-like head-tail connector protein [Candidatus Symbiopectobacterium sp. Dall1.0]
MFINKELVKRHCKIELDDNSDDVLLENYIATAEQKTISHLNRNLYSKSVPKNDPDGLVINAAIIQGMLLLVTSLYEHRGAVADLEQLPHFSVFKFLVDDYRLSGL